MRKLYVFGSLKTTCKNCRKAEAIVEEVIEGRESEFDYQKLTLDSQPAQDLGVMCTPTVVLDDEVLVMGEVPEKEALKNAFFE